MQSYGKITESVGRTPWDPLVARSFDKRMTAVGSFFQVTNHYTNPQPNFLAQIEVPRIENTTTPRLSPNESTI
jgi:hypothetical protein